MFTRSRTAFAAVALAAALAGCATSPKVTPTLESDASLDCNGIYDELAQLDRAEADVESKKGVTGTNVAAALFWLPGLIYTYMDAGDALRLIEQRRGYLNRLGDSKNCARRIVVPMTGEPPAE
ncbi:hypothetical protein [Marinivivus vitaminiproducens]|uniref:hypothetical protein n=1 Tax=Marinivivus vitaminiproducens TaxID=3035935 RepID=UPI0027A645E7|nr:hypothetical protein P4R82_01990 [Geminicoccaceae bacterium SCSIO 64248]